MERTERGVGTSSGYPNWSTGPEHVDLGRRRILALLSGLIALVVLGFLIAKPLVDQLTAKTGCNPSNGKWNSDSGVCDYGTGGAVVRLLEQSRHCQDVPESTLRKCTYSVERIQISVFGIGTSGAASAVDGSDERLGYGVGVFMGEGCIRVAPGAEKKERDPMRRIEDEFISTWTGNVYESMVACRSGGLEVRGVSEATARER